jgi:hypothetical protein
MTQRDTVDQIFRALVNAPTSTGLTCRTSDVLSACGMLIAAILNNGYTNAAERQVALNCLCRALQHSVNRNQDTIVRH